MEAKKIRVKVPASIGNVGSGFDCAGLSLKFYNEFFVEKSSKNSFRLCNKISSESEKKTEELFMHAFNTGLEYLGEKSFNVKTDLINRIPFRKGFGSSGTVILGGIVSAVKLCRCNVTKKDILNMAVPIEKHIDNLAASLYGGFVFGGYIDGRIVIARIPTDKDLRVISFIPGFELSTAEARKILPDKVPINDAIYNLYSFGFLCMAFSSKDFHLLRYGTRDRLHQIYRNRLMPYLEELTGDWKGKKILGACLSGAGPSVVFFTEKKSQDEAEKEVKHKIITSGLKGDVRHFSVGGRTTWKFLCE